MAVYQIPIVNAPQKFNVTLAGVTYQFVIQYRDDLGGLGGWFIDINDVAGNPILTGLPMVTGADLLAQYQYLSFGGSLYVQTPSNPDAVPTFDNLGIDSFLYWVDST